MGRRLRQPEGKMVPARVGVEPATQARKVPALPIEVTCRLAGRVVPSQAKLCGTAHACWNPSTHAQLGDLTRLLNVKQASITGSQALRTTTRDGMWCPRKDLKEPYRTKSDSNVRRHRTVARIGPGVRNASLRHAAPSSTVDSCSRTDLIVSQAFRFSAWQTS